MQRLEVENNRIFIEAYGLQDELTPDVPLNEITLTCNPHYRYANSKTDAELETQLQADTMAEFLSYAVGCMFGRYSIDQSGLILANQGDTLQHYLAKVPQPRFTPDADNVIPLIDFDGDWFEDDIAERFKHFLKITLGAENYPANLKFIEDALGKDVRKYFLKDFYADHVKRYKKRPIYWLFSSPKGTFNALIYLHRYQPDTASIVLNDYLREFRTKLTARKQALEQVGIRSDTKENQGEKTKALKAIAKIDQALAEINDYERDTLYPLATRQIALDLDDGVKVNYPKLGKALKSVAGLS
jgi:type II restriction/modification system DNA methylase subunit YeeA